MSQFEWQARVWIPGQSGNRNTSPPHLVYLKDIFTVLVVFLLAIQIVWPVVSLESIHLETPVTFSFGHMVSGFIFLHSIQVSGHYQANVLPQPGSPTYTTATATHGRGLWTTYIYLYLFTTCMLLISRSAKTESKKEPLSFASELPLPSPFFLLFFSFFGGELPSWISAPEKWPDHILSIFKHVQWSTRSAPLLPHYRNPGVIRFVVRIRTKWT